MRISALSLWLVMAASTAHAQSAEAEALFLEGNKLMAEAAFARACDAFEASNRIEPRAGTLMRLGECRERNQQIASAWSAYKDALLRVKDPAKKSIATAKAAELEAKLSYLTISIPQQSRVDGLSIERRGKPFDESLWGRSLPADGGAYVIVARAPGHRDWTTTVTVPIASGDVKLDIPRLEAIERSPKPDDPDDDAPMPTSMFTTKRKIALGVAGGGVAAFGVGIALGVQARSRRDDAYALCPDPQTPCANSARAASLVDSARSRALGANIAFGVGGAAVIAAGVLWFTGAPETRRELAIVPVVGSDETGFAVLGKF